MDRTVYYIIDKDLKRKSKLLNTVKRTKVLAVLSFGLSIMTLLGLGKLNEEVEILKSKGEKEM